MFVYCEIIMLCNMAERMFVYCEIIMLYNMAERMFVYCEIIMLYNMAERMFVYCEIIMLYNMAERMFVYCEIIMLYNMAERMFVYCEIIMLYNMAERMFVYCVPPRWHLAASSFIFSLHKHVMHCLGVAYGDMHVRNSCFLFKHYVSIVYPRVRCRFRMRITAFSKPSTETTVAPGSGITWKLSGGSLSIHGDWHFKYRQNRLLVFQNDRLTLH